MRKIQITTQQKRSTILASNADVVVMATPSFGQLQSIGALTVPDTGLCLSSLREMQAANSEGQRHHLQAQATQNIDNINAAAQVGHYTQRRPLDEIVTSKDTENAYPHDAASVIAINRERAKGWRMLLVSFTGWTAAAILLGAIEIGLNGSSLNTALPEIAGQEKAIGNDIVVLTTIATAGVCAFLKRSDTKLGKLAYWGCITLGLSASLLSGFAVAQSFFMGVSSAPAIISAGGIGNEALSSLQGAYQDNAQRAITIAEGLIAGTFGPFCWFGIKLSVENAKNALTELLKKRGFADIAKQTHDAQRRNAAVQAQLTSKDAEFQTRRNNLINDAAGAISKLCATKRAPVEAWLNELELAGAEADRSALPPEVRGYDLIKLRALVKTHQSQTSFEAIQANLLKAISPNKDMNDVQAEFDFDRPRHNGADRDGLPQASH